MISQGPRFGIRLLTFQMNMYTWHSTVFGAHATIREFEVPI